MNHPSQYDATKSYQWNYENAPRPVQLEIPPLPGEWHFAGLPIDSPLGIPAGPLLNGRWCLYYASLGFDLLTYKTVRSVQRECYPLPNLQPVRCGQLKGGEQELPVSDTMLGSWAVSFGMPSQPPSIWREDIESTRSRLPTGKLLSVSVVGTVQEGWSIEDLARDYAQCARWAIESGADCIETNFSCPNVSTCDGQLYQQPESAGIVAAAVRSAVGNVPYIVKVGHVNSHDQARHLLSALAPFVDALAMTNSVAATVATPNGSLLFGGEPRGICGDATREASLRQLKLFADLARDGGIDMQLIGVGGASSAQHVLQYLQSGAHAVHIATAAMANPLIGVEIRRQIADALRRTPYESV